MDAASRQSAAGSPRKRIAFDAQTWHAPHQFSLDGMKSLQEPADEAFRDLLTKHRRSTTLKEMLRASGLLRATGGPGARECRARPCTGVS